MSENDIEEFGKGSLVKGTLAVGSRNGDAVSVEKKIPIALGNDLKGGLHSVETIEELYSIPFEKRQVGMEVFVSYSSKFNKAKQVLMIVENNENVDVSSEEKEVNIKTFSSNTEMYNTPSEKGQLAFIPSTGFLYMLEGEDYHDFNNWVVVNGHDEDYGVIIVDTFEDVLKQKPLIPGRFCFTLDTHKIYEFEGIPSVNTLSDGNYSYFIEWKEVNNVEIINNFDNFVDIRSRFLGKWFFNIHNGKMYSFTNIGSEFSLDDWIELNNIIPVTDLSELLNSDIRELSKRNYYIINKTEENKNDYTWNVTDFTTTHTFRRDWDVSRIVKSKPLRESNNPAVLEKTRYLSNELTRLDSEDWKQTLREIDPDRNKEFFINGKFYIIKENALDVYKEWNKSEYTPVDGRFKDYEDEDFLKFPMNEYAKSINKPYLVMRNYLYSKNVELSTYNRNTGDYEVLDSTVKNTSAYTENVEEMTGTYPRFLSYSNLTEISRININDFMNITENTLFYSEDDNIFYKPNVNLITAISKIRDWKNLDYYPERSYNEILNLLTVTNTFNTNWQDITNSFKEELGYIIAGNEGTSEAIEYTRDFNSGLDYYRFKEHIDDSEDLFLDHWVYFSSHNKFVKKVRSSNSSSNFTFIPYSSDDTELFLAVDDDTDLTPILTTSDSVVRVKYEDFNDFIAKINSEFYNKTDFRNKYILIDRVNNFIDVVENDATVETYDNIVINNKNYIVGDLYRVKNLLNKKEFCKVRFIDNYVEIYSVIVEKGKKISFYDIPTVMENLTEEDTAFSYFMDGEGRTFEGWRLENNNTTISPSEIADTIVNDNITYIAKWKSNSGLSSNQRVIVETNIPNKSFELSGSRRKLILSEDDIESVLNIPGCYLEEIKDGNNNIIDLTKGLDLNEAVTTIYATYHKKSLRLVVDLNEGKLDQSIPKGVIFEGGEAPSINFDELTPTKDGYNFEGWVDYFNNSIEYHSFPENDPNSYNDDFVSDMIVKAKWSKTDSMTKKNAFRLFLSNQRINLQNKEFILIDFGCNDNNFISVEKDSDINTCLNNAYNTFKTVYSTPLGYHFTGFELIDDNLTEIDGLPVDNGRVYYYKALYSNENKITVHINGYEYEYSYTIGNTLFNAIYNSVDFRNNYTKTVIDRKNYYKYDTNKLIKILGYYTDENYNYETILDRILIPDGNTNINVYVKSEFFGYSAKLDLFENNQHLVKQVVINLGEEFLLPEDSGRNGYYVKRWEVKFVNNVEILEVLGSSFVPEELVESITAIYLPVTFKVRFHSTVNNVDLVSFDDNMIYSFENIVNIPFIRDLTDANGYSLDRNNPNEIFLGWVYSGEDRVSYVDGDSFGYFAPDSDIIDLYALWEPVVLEKDDFELVCKEIVVEENTPFPYENRSDNSIDNINTFLENNSDSFAGKLFLTDIGNRNEASNYYAFYRFPEDNGNYTYTYYEKNAIFNNNFYSLLSRSWDTLSSDEIHLLKYNDAVYFFKPRMSNKNLDPNDLNPSDTYKAVENLCDLLSVTDSDRRNYGWYVKSISRFYNYKTDNNLSLNDFTLIDENLLRTQNILSLLDLNDYDHGQLIYVEENNTVYRFIVHEETKISMDYLELSTTNEKVKGILPNNLEIRRFYEDNSDFEYGNIIDNFNESFYSIFDNCMLTDIHSIQDTKFDLNDFTEISLRKFINVNSVDEVINYPFSDRRVGMNSTALYTLNEKRFFILNKLNRDGAYGKYREVIPVYRITNSLNDEEGFINGNDVNVYNKIIVFDDTDNVVRRKYRLIHLGEKNRNTTEWNWELCKDFKFYNYFKISTVNGKKVIEVKEEYNNLPAILENLPEDTVLTKKFFLKFIEEYSDYINNGLIQVKNGHLLLNYSLADYENYLNTYLTEEEYGRLIVNKDYVDKLFMYTQRNFSNTILEIRKGILGISSDLLTKSAFEEHIKTYHPVAVTNVDARNCKLRNVYALANHKHYITWADINEKPEFALKNHNHDGKYAKKNHNHDQIYSPISHSHNDTYAAVDHVHDEYILKTEVLGNGKVYNMDLVVGKTCEISYNGRIPTIMIYNSEDNSIIPLGNSEIAEGFMEEYCSIKYDIINKKIYLTLMNVDNEKFNTPVNCRVILQ